MKPETCVGCPLYESGKGYAPGTGPEDAVLTFVGEALGEEEARKGAPFVGPAGALLDRLLRLVNIDREAVRIDNICRCQPPRNWLVGAPWEYAAIQHCYNAHLGPYMEERGGTAITLGMTSTRKLLDLPRKGCKIEHFHGTLNYRGTWRIVPTFHPAFLLRGNQRLIGCSAFDLFRALQEHEEEEEPPVLQVDPPVEWFAEWADAYMAEHDELWLAVDIETPDKAKKGNEDELAYTDRSWAITRVNFACSPDEGITVPWQGAYIEIARRILAAPGVKCFWNAPYDVPRLIKNECPCGGELLDFMDAFHVLQSDMPRSLGFAAPFYSDLPPWKHLSDVEPGRYAALDAVQTLRCAYGIAEDLQRQGMWEVFYNHVHKVYWSALEPAQQVGLMLDDKALADLRIKLQESLKGIRTELQAKVPQEIRPLLPKTGLSRPPKAVPAGFSVVQGTQVLPTRVCLSCGASGVVARHRCKDKKLTPQIELQDLEQPRWWKQGLWNPASRDHVLAYVEHKGWKAGKHAKTGRTTVDELSLDALARKSKDPVLEQVLVHRKIHKVLSTYVEGVGEFADSESRIHPQFTRKPSTLRSSCQAPNLQNIVARSETDGIDLANEFRRCIVASPGCKLIEIDYSGIEAVEVGWFCGDPAYIRLAKLGVHAYLCSHLVGKPADLSWSDTDLRAYFSELKKKYKATAYDKAKRSVHGSAYGLTAYGMARQFPKTFPSVSAAQKVQRLYFDIAPAVPKWQRQVQERAHEQHYLGGPGDHPFGYKHYFWAVFNYKAVSRSECRALKAKGRPTLNAGGRYFQVILGEDAKRAIAFYPQSTAAGVIFDSLLRLCDQDNPNYIGDFFHGRTPIRAVIHDSIFMEVPTEKVDTLMERVSAEMLRPIVQQPCPPEWNLGEYLSIGAEASIGDNWADMEKLELGG